LLGFHRVDESILRHSQVALDWNSSQVSKTLATKMIAFLHLLQHRKRSVLVANRPMQKLMSKTAIALLLLLLLRAAAQWRKFAGIY
jgi:hypothetical protein